MRQHYKFWPALIIPLPTLSTPRQSILAFIPLPVNRFSNKLAPNGSISILRILYFVCNCFLTPFFNKPGSSKDLTIYMISFISSFKIIDPVTLDQRVVLHIPAFAVDTAVVNRNSIKMLLANGLSTFFIKGTPVFHNWQKRLPKYLLSCTISDT